MEWGSVSLWCAVTLDVLIGKFYYIFNLKLLKFKNKKSSTLHSGASPQKEHIKL